MKYITYEGPGYLEMMIVFSELEVHKEVARRLCVRPISAGFIYIDVQSETTSLHREGGWVRCRGRSESLGLDSRGTIDEELFARMT